MRVLFVYPNHIGEVYIRIGIGYLSSYLEKFGHKTQLLDLTFGWNPKKSAEQIKKFKPGLICFSVLSTELEFSLKVAEFLKQNFNIPIVFGGVHPTIEPEETIKNKNVDMVCIGEGEHTLLELVEKMESRKSITKVRGLWVKKSGKIYKNPVRPLETNLDKFPFPNREIFDKRHFMMEYPGTPFLTARGCPFQCTFCCNHLFQKIYNYDNYVRFRSVDNVLDEMEFAVKKHKIKYVYLADDTFTIRKDRVLEFCKKYSERISLPFRCMANPNSIDREIMFALKKAGCLSVHMGIESGNDRLRCEVMKRPFSKKQIINVFKWAREAGLKTASFNVIGIPGETRKTVFETIELNRACKPDVAQVSIFYPFPYTKLWEICKEKKYMSGRSTNSYFEDTVLDLPTISRKELIALQKTFQLYVALPKWLWFIPLTLEKTIKYSPLALMGFYGFLMNGINLLFFSFDKRKAVKKMPRRAMEIIKRKIA